MIVKSQIFTKTKSATGAPTSNAVKSPKKHVRHNNPPLISRTWVLSEEGRGPPRIGYEIDCKHSTEATDAEKKSKVYLPSRFRHKTPEAALLLNGTVGLWCKRGSVSNNQPHAQCKCAP